MDCPQIDYDSKKKDKVTYSETKEEELAAMNSIFN